MLLVVVSFLKRMYYDNRTSNGEVNQETELQENRLH